MVDSSKISMSAVFVGLDGAGKTTLLRQLSSNSEKEIMPTSGFEIHYINVQILTAPVLVYDCAGQGPNRENWKTFYEVVDCIGFVIDLEDKDRIHLVDRYLDDILKDEQVQKKQLPIFLFFNKSDLKNRSELNVLRKYLDIDKKKRKYKMTPLSWKEVSAFQFNQSEFEECFQWLKDNRHKKKQ